MSKTEARKGRRGTLSYYWGVDVRGEPRADDGDAYTATDVDYYMDINSLLVKKKSPVFLYTCVPKAAANPDGDFTWSFKEDGSVKCVSGNGRVYEHQLWDYSDDNYVIYDFGPWWISWLLRFFTIPLSYSIFACDRRSTSQHHSLVLFTPIKSGGVLGAVAMFPLVPENRISRFNPIVVGEQHKWAYYQVMTAATRLTTVAKVGSTACCTLNSGAFDSAQAHHFVTKQGTSPYSISECSTNNGGPEKLATTSADTLSAAMFLKDVSSPTPNHIMQAGDYVESKAFFYVNSDPEEEPILSLRSFSAPFIDNGFFPCLSEGNDKACVEGRINKVRSTATLSSRNRGLVIDFVESIKNALPDGGYLPASVEEVFDRQPRPTQQNILFDAVNTAGDSNLTKCFQKKEAYGKVTEPRNISTFAPREKLHRSQVAYVLTDIVKIVFGDCYAGGLTPASIAAKVSLICTGSSFVLASDFSRMDGRISPAARESEDILLSILFSQEIADLMAETLPEKGITTFNQRFAVGTSRSSGDPFTTIMNTLLYILIVYCSLRHHGLSKDLAFDHLLLKMVGMGDDGVVGDCDEETFVKTCTAFGQVVKVQKIPRGEWGVNFLSRFYGPGVWNNNPNSICDVKRQLSKWHLTANKNMSDNEILLAKARAFYLSDHDTPIIGPLCKKIMEVVGETPPNENGKNEDDHEEWYKKNKSIVSWFSQYEYCDQYPNHDVQSFVEKYFGVFNLGQFNDWLSGCESLEDLRMPPQIAPPDPIPPASSDVVVGGTPVKGVLSPSTPEKSSSEPAKPAQKKTRGKKRGKRGAKGKSPSREENTTPKQK
jgi:hypothetical protein